MSTTWPRWLCYIFGLGWQIWAPTWLRRSKAKKVIAIWSWLTLIKMTLFLYLAKLKFSPRNLLQSHNEPKNTSVWHCRWCKSIVCMVSKKYFAFFMEAMTKCIQFQESWFFGQNTHFSYLLNSWNLTCSTKLRITSTILLQIQKLFLWLKAECHG